MNQFYVTGMSCAACSARVEKAVSKVPGVDSCSVSLLTNSMGVEGSAAPDAVIDAVKKAGYGASLKGDPAANNGNDHSGRMRSDAAYSEQERALEDHETPLLKKRLCWSLGFLAVLMYFSMGHTMFGWPLPGFFEGNHVAMGLVQMMLASVVMMINQKFFISGARGLINRAPNMDTLVALGSAASYVWSVCMLFAMTRAQVDGGSEAAAHYMHEFYFESAAMILTLITVGKMLEARSKGKTTDALKSLIKLAPKTAILLKECKDSCDVSGDVEGLYEEVETEVSNVMQGDIFVVKPGSNVPVDGVVIYGSSAVDESALTGESIPVDKAEGDKVSAGTVNQSGYMRCRATRVGEDTSLAQIIKMVSEASATKAPIAKIADKVSGVFVPIVIGIALVTLVVWLLAGQTAGFALARAISVLVISCPCALGLATPVAIMVGSGVGAKNGVLFKTAVSLEETGKSKVVVLDKTGTITKGEPQVTDVIPAEYETVSEDELLELAVLLEEKSEHPLAKAIIKYSEEKRPVRTLNDNSLRDLKILPGNGLEAIITKAPVANEPNKKEQVANEPNKKETVANEAPAKYEIGYLSAERQAMEEASDGCSEIEVKICGGNRDLISRYAKIPPDVIKRSGELADEGKTCLFFAEGERYMGMIAVADVIKEESPQAISELKDLGIDVVMLTGDNEKTARAIAKQAGAADVIAQVLPDGKAREIGRLKEYGRVAMVGDGINDAPALVSADTGIAIGAGTDVAIDAGDVVLMKSALTDVPAAIRLSRQTLRNIRQNLFWAFIYNIIGIPLAAGVWIPVFGWTLDPMFGAAAMSLSSFCVVTNALRLNFFDMHDASKDRPLRGGKQAAGRADKFDHSIADTANNEKEKNTMEKTMKIEGMMCPHCEAAVKGALEALDGVSEAKVSHEADQAVVIMDGEVADDVLKKAVEDKDYKVVSIG